MARIRPFDEVCRIVADRCLSPQAQGKMVAAAARSLIADADAQNARVLGERPLRDTFVDGRKGASLESVHLPNGTILVEYRLIVDAVEWVRDQLFQHAPVLTGRFKGSFLLFADGYEVSPDGPLPIAKEYEFLSDQPYSRKLEGIGRRRPLSPKAPDGVFEVVAGLAHARFGNLARIGFALRSLPSGAIGRWADTESAKRLAQRRRGGQRRLHREWLTRTPTVWIQPR